MMLPSDYALIQDAEFKKWVEIYADDKDRFFDDFAKVSLPPCPSFCHSSSESSSLLLTSTTLPLFFLLQAFGKLLELGVERGEDGWALLKARAKEEGVAPEKLAPKKAFTGGCPFTNHKQPEDNGAKL